MKTLYQRLMYVALGATISIAVHNGVDHTVARIIVHSILFTLFATTIFIEVEFKKEKIKQIKKSLLMNAVPPIVITVIILGWYASLTTIFNIVNTGIILEIVIYVIVTIVYGIILSILHHFYTNYTKSLR